MLFSRGVSRPANGVRRLGSRSRRGGRTSSRVSGRRPRTTSFFGGRSRLSLLEGASRSRTRRRWVIASLSFPYPSFSLPSLLSLTMTKPHPFAGPSPPPRPLPPIPLPGLLFHHPNSHPAQRAFALFGALQTAPYLVLVRVGQGRRAARARRVPGWL